MCHTSTIFILSLAFLVQIQDASAQERACLGQAEMRQALEAHTLIPPVDAMRRARVAAPGDVVRLRLCREAEHLVYQVTTVRKDGGVVRVTIDGASGKVSTVR
jgi:uncharacterized membrane protein YkoI